MNNQAEKYLQYYEILELDNNATMADVTTAYKKLKELYSSESIVIDAIDDEFSQEERLEIVNQLEEAYKVLVNFIVEKDRSEKESVKIEEKLGDTAKEEMPMAEELLPPPEDLDDLEGQPRVEEPRKEKPREEEIFVLEEKVREISLSGQDESATVLVYENEHEDEHIHIELPAKETDEDENLVFEKNSMEINADTKDYESKYLTPVEQPLPIENPVPIEEPFPVEEPLPVEEPGLLEEPVLLKKPAHKDTWEEYLLKKDVKTLKEEITRDFKEGLTISKSKSASAIEPGAVGGSEDIFITGHTMRKAREKMAMGVHEIALNTRIHYKILVNIEKERFSKLPEPGYLRWYLQTYAKALSLDPKRAADDYMALYRRWQRDQEKQK